MFRFLIRMLIPSLACSVPALWACEDQFVRDVAFRESRDVHRLSVIMEPGDAQGEQMVQDLQQWMKQQPDVNLELHQLMMDDPQVSWSDYGMPSCPPSAPVVVLSGFHTFEQSAFYIDHWQPGPSLDDLASLVDSPARDVLARNAATHLAVLLYVPAARESDRAAPPLLDTLVRNYAKKPLSLAALTVERTDPRERVLLSFLGVKAEGPDWLSVVFGRGKVMPPLQGDEITADSVESHLAELQEVCSCLRSTLSMGVDLPMRWTPDLQLSAITLASLKIPGDPSSPSAGLHYSLRSWNPLTSSIASILVLFMAILLTGASILWKRSLSQ